MNIIKTKNLIKEINQNQVRIIAVSKYQTNEDVQTLIDLEITDFAENTAQNLIKRQSLFPSVNWHFIGRIQSNKIKQIVKCATLIHSVSDLKHLSKIDAEAAKINKVQSVLIQLNLANESTKSGIMLDELEAFLLQASQYKNIKLKGLMLIGDHTEDQEKIKATFDLAKSTYDHFTKIYNFSYLSMGMSSDYQLAIKSGSNTLRLGSILFK